MPDCSRGMGEEPEENEKYYNRTARFCKLEIVHRTGLIPLVTQPTRGYSILDRLFVSKPAAVYRCLGATVSALPSVSYLKRLSKVFQSVWQIK